MKPWRELAPPGPIWADELNALAAEVRRLSKLDVDGGDAEDGPGGRLLRIPRPADRHVVRVYAEDNSESGSGSGSGSGSDCDATSYRWVRQVPNRCGEWVDETPIALTGSTANHNPAFNPNAGQVADGTVVEITRGAAYIDDAGSPVQEWVVVAVGGAGTDDEEFYAWLQAYPDDPIYIIGEPGHVAAFDCGSGAGSGSTQEGCPRGYAWIRVTTDGCGRWTPLIGAGGVGYASAGTQCIRPAYEVNGLRAPVGITDSDGNARYTVVRLRRAPTNKFAGQPSDIAIASYLFDWNLAQCRQGDADVPSGSGVAFAGRSNVVMISFPFLNGDGICCTKTVTMTYSPTVEVCVTESEYCPPSGSGG